MRPVTACTTHTNGEKSSHEFSNCGDSSSGSRHNLCSNRASTHKALEEAKDLVSSLTPARGIAQRRRSRTPANLNDWNGMQQPNVNDLRNTAPSRPTATGTRTAESDSIQGRRDGESRKEYLHRVLDRVTELGERKPPAKPKAACHHANHDDAAATQQPPPPPSYDEALALGLFLDDKLALNQESTSHATPSHSRDNNSRRALRRSRPLNQTSSQAQGIGIDYHAQQDQPSQEQPTRRRSVRKGSLVERTHSLASEESVRAEMERIQREFAEDEDEQDASTTKMSQSTRQSKDDVYRHPPALDDRGHGKEEESESGASLLLVAKRDSLPSMRDAQSRPCVG